jgi:hypothetical protein
LDLLDVHLVQTRGGKGSELLGGLHQPTQDRIGIDPEDPGRAPDAQTFGQARDDAHDDLRRGVLAMKDRAVSLREIARAGDTLQLAPGLAAGMTIGAQVAASEPAVVGTIRCRTEVRLGVDGAPASSGESDERRGLTGCLGACIGSLLTGLAQRFVNQPGKGPGFLRAFASAFIGCEGRLGLREWHVGQPDMDEEAEEDKSHHEEWVKQRGRYHDAVLFHGDERRRLYCIRSLSNYPLPTGIGRISMLSNHLMLLLRVRSYVGEESTYWPRLLSSCNNRILK